LWIRAEGSVNNPIPAFSVSVVITAYNAANWIEETLNSILAQTYPVLEVIVVDDGSTDKTAKKVLSYGGNIKYIYQDNSGQPSARNHGIRSARGEYIAFVDADDYWHPQKIEKQVNLIRFGGADWVVCDSEWINENKERVEFPVLSIQEGFVLEKLLMGNFIISATPMIRRDVFDCVGYFNEDPEARIGEDWDMWLRIASRFPLRVVHEKLAYVRLHQSSMMSTTNIRDKTKGLHGVVERAVDREPHRLMQLKNFAFANIYHQAGVQLTKRGEYNLAREFFFRELQYRPVKFESWVYLFMTTAGKGLSSPIIKIKRFLEKQFNNLKKR
jgi:glycosyltransferase involved in cell wall biosynthesis